MSLRRAVPDDLDVLRSVCLRTGDDGRDATGRWSDDGLLPDVYLEPYLRFPESIAFVADEGGGPAGYLLAVPDTRALVRWWREHWVPVFRARHGRAPAYADERWLFDGGLAPELMLRDVPLDAFPAQLHIDLLPEAQGRGLGRQLIRRLGHELVALGVPGVHLGVSRANSGAVAFYDRIGFDALPGSTGSDGLLMTAPARRLADLPAF